MRQEVNPIKTESEKQEKKYGADSISKMRLCTWVGSCFTNIEYVTYLPKINSIKVIKSTCTPLTRTEKGHLDPYGDLGAYAIRRLHPVIC